MNILILEDEPLAIEGIQQILSTNFTDITRVDTAQSIREGEQLLSDQSYNLIISDIKLNDGMSFDLFNKRNVDLPIIFTTAYDQFAIEAFDCNGVAYVLKPINEDKLVKAVQKARDQAANHSDHTGVNQAVLQLLNKSYQKQSYKKRFLSKVGTRMIIKQADDISAFFTENKVVFMKEIGSNKKYAVNHSLDELEKCLLDPDQFYRINRSVIVNLDSLAEIKNYSNGRLQIITSSQESLDLIVARDRVPEFKEWINQ